MATYYAREKYQPQLYADVKSHVGQFGVIKLPNEPQYHRIKILQELANDAEILLIDDGSRMTVSRGDVLAPLSNLTTFLLPPFGIECKVDNVPLSDTEWSSVLENQPVHVLIEDRENGFYKVSFTDNPCNGKIKLAITEKPNENGVRSSPGTFAFKILKFCPRKLII